MIVVTTLSHLKLLITDEFATTLEAIIQAQILGLIVKLKDGRCVVCY